MTNLPGDKLYICKKCNSKYTEREADVLNFLCCDEEMTNLEANPRESSDDTTEPK